MAINILDSESNYAKRRRQHLLLINKLRGLGAQADLDLPRIAVIGNQSAGKSSLVEAISGISVPRDAGTCTRCPIECRMADATESWRCQISIRWEFHDTGRRRDKVEELPFGNVITEPQNVELALRQAQAAVLNPSVDPSSFLDMSEAMLKQRLAKNELTFSRNAVCVDLAGPGLVDLAFVDLPGIIQNADPDIVKLVEDLVRSHIEGNCLILVTLPMSDDIENQKAMSLARQVDPTGSRTIGVLTKPDTLTSGATRSKELWLDVIEGRNPKFPLRLGYYCTRQPDEDERTAGIASAEARKVEESFFQKTVPWSASTCPQQFGTRNLVAHLSRLLTDIINKSLPNIVNETDRQLDECIARLSAMPARIDEPTSFVLALITRFCVRMHAFVEGALDTATLVQACRLAYGRYKVAIRATAPAFLPYPHAGAARGDIDAGRVARFLALDDDEGSTKIGTYLYLNDVRTRINEAITRELPNNIPYVAKVSFIKDFQRDWATHTRRCVDAVHAALLQTVLDLVHETFGAYGRLELKVRRAVEDLIRAKLEAAGAQTLRVLRYESTPFTQNDHYLGASKDKFLALYKSARAGAKEAKSMSLAAPKSALLAATAPHANNALGKSGLFAAPAAAQPAQSSPFTPATTPAPSSMPATTASTPKSPFGASAAPATSTTIRPYDCPGTVGRALFAEVVRDDSASPRGCGSESFQSISCRGDYSNWSFEELRTADYQKNPSSINGASFSIKAVNADSSSATPKSAGGMFGASAFAAKVDSPFSSAAPSSNTQPTVKLFGGLNGSAAPLASTTSESSEGVAGSRWASEPGTMGAPPLSSPPFSFPTGIFASSAATAALSSGMTEEERRREEKLVLAGLAKLGYTGIVPADLGKLVPPDEYERELEVMAEVRAYFKVAHKRVIDYVPLVIDHEFVRAFGDALQEHLVRQLGLGTPDAAAKCAAYVEEDPFVAATRDELMGRKARLESVRDELVGFGL